ncbi:MAG TPA: cytochrome C oxidase subunit IV family protein [Burkholderiaceae bacterium]|nr:cytochrome C oxidase subunit IV family protein [Burkholderiaceae bacterium]
MNARPNAAARAGAVWLILVTATVLSWGLVEHHAVPARIATTVALAIAAFKARLVFLHFMELHSAPWPWRVLFEAWALLCVVAILTAYWLGLA